MTDRHLSPFERLLTLFTRVLPGEGRAVALQLAHGFLLMTAYYLIRPVRDALILTEGSAELRAYATGFQALILMALLPLYGAVFRMQASSLLIQRIVFFLASSLVAFFLAGQAGLSIGFPFFVWAGIVGVLLVAQFWAFSTDLFNVKSGQRLFAVVAVGVSAGAVAGAQIAKLLFDVVGSYGLMLASAGTLLLTLPLGHWAHRSVPAASRSLPVEEPPRPSQKWLGGLSLVVRKPYLALLAALVVLLNWTMTTGEYVLSDWVVQAAAELPEAERESWIGGFFADVFAWITVLGLVIQLLFVSRIILTFGLRFAAAMSPALFVVGYLALGIFPVLALAKWVIVIAKSLDYSLLSTSRNALLLPTSRASKYEGKTAIDTFFFRFGDLLSAATVFVMHELLSLGSGGFIAVSAALSAVMLLVALNLGRRYQKKAASPEFNMPPVVNRRIPPAVVTAGAPLEHAFARDAFVDADPGDILTLEAKLESGEPLPPWLEFDAHGRRFCGTPPAGVTDVLAIEVTARDYDGLTASQTFTLELRPQ